MSVLAVLPSYRYLEVIDRETGDRERIRLDDTDRVSEAMRMVRERSRLTSQQVWDILMDGGQLSSNGFLRRLV